MDAYTPKHDFLVCVDSDGCAFDTMEIKHKECFCPVTIREWDLQMLSSYVRDAWEYAIFIPKAAALTDMQPLCRQSNLSAKGKRCRLILIFFPI